MTPEEWFDKRARLAVLFGCQDGQVIPETVWYLDEEELTSDDLAPGRPAALQLARM